MLNRLRFLLSINIYELNFLFCLIGFSTFTTLLPESFPSILYRAIALLLSIMCLIMTKGKVSIPKSKALFVFWGIFTLLLIRTLYEVYFGDLAINRNENTKRLIILFAVGVSYIPVMSVLFTFKRIEWSRTLVIFLIVAIIVTAKGLMSMNPELLTSDGRYNLNSRQSTLAFGEYAGTLLLLSLSLLMRKLPNYKLTLLLKWCCIIGILIGVFGVAKAGSRGPFISTLLAVLYLVSISPKSVKSIFALFLGILLVAGYMVLRELEELAPVLVTRMTYTIADGDTNGRSDLAAQALNLIYEHPICGTNYLMIDEEQFTSYHNCYLTVAVALGAFIGIIYTLLIIKLLFESVRNRHLVNNSPELFCICLFIYFCFRSLTGVELLSDGRNSLIVIFTCLVNHKLHRKRILTNKYKQNERKN